MLLPFLCDWLPSGLAFHLPLEQEVVQDYSTVPSTSRDGLPEGALMLRGYMNQVHYAHYALCLSKTVGIFVFGPHSGRSSSTNNQSTMGHSSMVQWVPAVTSRTPALRRLPIVGGSISPGKASLSSLGSQHQKISPKISTALTRICFLDVPAVGFRRGPLKGQSSW